VRMIATHRRLRKSLTAGSASICGCVIALMRPCPYGNEAYEAGQCNGKGASDPGSGRAADAVQPFAGRLEIGIDL
jgi:hypothetical protein